MLGITVADAVLIGTLIVSVLAAWRGAKAGSSAANKTPPEPALAMIGGALVDRATLQDLTSAIRDLNTTLREVARDRADNRRGRMEDAIDRLVEALKEKETKGRQR